MVIVLFFFPPEGFLEKNRDAVSSDMINMVKKTKNMLLQQIFEEELSTNNVKISNNKKIVMTPNNSLRVWKCTPICTSFTFTMLHKSSTYLVGQWC